MFNNKKIAELFKFLPKSKSKAGDGQEYGEYPFYTSSNDLTKYIDEYLFEPNKLVFGTGGNASLHYADKPFGTSADCYVIEPKTNDINVKYVYYYLKYNFQILEEGFKGAGLKHISKEYLSNIQVKYPSIEEQDRVVAMLDKVQAIKNNKIKSNNYMEILIKSTFFSIFSDVDYPSEFLENIFTLTSGKFLPAKDMDSNGEYPVYGGNGITGYHNEYLFEEPQLCIGRVGVKCGCIHKTLENCWITDNALYVTSYKQEIDEIYLKYALENLNLNQFANKSSQPVISQSTIYKQKILLPPIEKQKLFAQIIKKIELQQINNLEVIDKINNLCNSLMQRAFV